MQLVPFRSEISPLHFVPVEMTETAGCRRSFTPNTGIQKSVETKLHAFLMSLFLLAEEAEEVNEDVNEIQVQGEGAHDGYLLSFVGGPGMIGEGQAFDGLGVINGEARENQDAGVGNKHLQQGAVEEETHDRGQDDAEKSHEAHISQLRQIRLRHIAVHRHDAEGAGGHEEHAADGRKGVGQKYRRQGNAVQHRIHQKHDRRRFQRHFPHGRVMDNTPVGCVFVIHIPVKRSESKPTKIEQVQVTDKPVEDISTLQIPEFYMASNAGEESEEEPNHIITIEGLEEDIRRLESGNTEEIAEEKNIETISAVAPQRATVIQLIEGEDNEMITHIIPPEELPEMVTAVPEEKSEQKLKTVWNHAYIDFKPSGTAITSMDEKLINHAVKYVEDNIARSDLSVEELSKELGMSRVHLYKKLLAITGKTPIEFIRIIRLQRAAQLLRGSQQNISEIAYQVGFNNPKYFSRYFKEEFGILPSAFQYRQGR